MTSHHETFLSTEASSARSPERPNFRTPLLHTHYRAIFLVLLLSAFTASKRADAVKISVTGFPLGFVIDRAVNLENGSQIIAGWQIDLRDQEHLGNQVTPDPSNLAVPNTCAVTNRGFAYASSNLHYVLRAKLGVAGASYLSPLKFNTTVSSVSLSPDGLFLLVTDNKRAQGVTVFSMSAYKTVFRFAIGYNCSSAVFGCKARVIVAGCSSKTTGKVFTVPFKNGIFFPKMVRSLNVPFFPKQVAASPRCAYNVTTVGKRAVHGTGHIAVLPVGTLNRLYSLNMPLTRIIRRAVIPVGHTASFVYDSFNKRYLVVTSIKKLADNDQAPLIPTPSYTVTVSIGQYYDSKGIANAGFKRVTFVSPQPAEAVGPIQTYYSNPRAAYLPTFNGIMIIDLLTVQQDTITAMYLQQGSTPEGYDYLPQAVCLQPYVSPPSPPPGPLSPPPPPFVPPPPVFST